MIKTSPSILAADFVNLKTEIDRVKNADMLHVDVMDGHFVPNISVGIPVVASLSRSTDILLDVHLMITNPLEYIESFANAGAGLICFHIEANSDAIETIRKIKSFGKKAGIAIKPKTPASAISHIIGLVDMILVMTVEPGFGGQQFMPDMLDKITQIRQMVNCKGGNVDIQVDGGINLETGAKCVEHGANVLVAGSFVFCEDNGEDTATRRIEELRCLI